MTGGAFSGRFSGSEGASGAIRGYDVRVMRIVGALLVVALFACFIILDLKSSWIEAHILSKLVGHTAYAVGQGASPALAPLLKNRQQDLTTIV
jgi:hypothetical protein